MRVARISWLLVACGAPASHGPVANQVPASGPSPSCRAAVAKHYDSGTQRVVDPSGRTVVVTTSDACGLVLQPIDFDRDATTFRTEAADALAGMLACLDQTEHLRVRLDVVGHASRDERGAESLALARAETIERYLLACGVPVLGLSASAEPPATGERARRVDFVIVERQGPD